MALILVRHTRPLGAEGLCYGKTDLPPGPELAADAARLNAELPQIKRILTSPLMRAARLAEALGALRGTQIAMDARLAEMDFGSWEGVPWNDIPRDELDVWADDLLGARPHGGESVAMMAGRVTECLNDHHDALFVTHMGPIRAALAKASHKNAWEAKVEFGKAVFI